MDESMVDIVLIILAALVAVAVVPEFNVALPVSREIDESERVLRPLQISISGSGTLYYKNESNEEQDIQYQELYDMLVASPPTRIVEVHADEGAPAIYLLELNRVIQKAGRNATFLVQSGS